MKKILTAAVSMVFMTLFVSTISFADINKPGSVGWKPPVRSQQMKISKTADSNSGGTAEKQLAKSCSCTSKQGSGSNETSGPCKAN
ncbi:MAG: hypothetical protein HZA77_06125 [Candidatus Schekmanbacteria bacterium]|nr:hypothetical protein [Candidatus Schekmanbacteria bacterium]